MDRKEALKELAVCTENGDTETAHLDADQVLCDLLCSLGYADVVEVYSKVEKWYA